MRPDSYLLPTLLLFSIVGGSVLATGDPSKQRRKMKVGEKLTPDDALKTMEEKGEQHLGQIAIHKISIPGFTFDAKTEQFATTVSEVIVPISSAAKFLLSANHGCFREHMEDYLCHKHILKVLENPPKSLGELKKMNSGNNVPKTLSIRMTLSENAVLGLHLIKGDVQGLMRFVGERNLDTHAEMKARYEKMAEHYTNTPYKKIEQTLTNLVGGGTSGTTKRRMAEDLYSNISQLFRSLHNSVTDVMRVGPEVEVAKLRMSTLLLATLAAFYRNAMLESVRKSATLHRAESLLDVDSPAGALRVKVLKKRPSFNF